MAISAGKKLDPPQRCYPHSAMQEGMLFHSLRKGGNGVDITQVIVDCPEKLETAFMEEAWQKLAKRHAVLRTSFRWEGLAEPRQEVHPGIRVPFAQKDWAGSPAAEQKARLEALLQEERRQGFELTVAPLMRVVLIRKSEADFTLVWTYHHILLDARSLGILLKELFLIYEGLRQGSPVALASTKPYCGYIEW